MTGYFYNECICTKYALKSNDINAIRLLKRVPLIYFPISVFSLTLSASGCRLPAFMSSCQHFHINFNRRIKFNAYVFARQYSIQPLSGN
jgi:hypothetical protein